jgi:catechol 2,3-dioxygenase-like lactoylglutathione lyase family enzyme
MPAPAIEVVRKFHASLNVSDLDRSVGFYSVLLGRPPAKLHSDYAKFEIDNPPLVLSLNPCQASAGGALNHAGLRVSSAQELVEIQRRLEEAGFQTQREDNVECCYARQTKFWISDPDRTLWEVYVFHEDIEERGAASIPDAARESAFAKDVSRSTVRWKYSIPDPFPSFIPHADNSLDEVQLEGAFNLNWESGGFARLVGEVFRTLRPGRLLRVRGLAADRPLDTALPPLPGPATVVECVPTAIEPMQIMLAAGFIDVRFERLSQTALFTIAGVPLREVVLTGAKPGYRPKKLTHHAVYLGPLSQVSDDFGNVFRRGERVSLNIHDWQVLSNSVVAAQFQFFPAPSLLLAQDGCCTAGVGPDDLT